MRYRISEEAERDLEEIFVYWANRASLEAADRIIDKIAERFWLLGDHPKAGKSAGNIARGVRCFPAGQYLIYYSSLAGTRIRLQITHKGRVFEALGRVADVRPSSVIGIVFTKVEEHYQLVLEKWIAELRDKKLHGNN